ncbi:hypothetical protein JSE7799_00293 [Jannaschia seosinensis]|uniref:Uncharacterized protein n=1 Tax=Jannaschia seosinensis TaxID=313367 RepID=A0A0M7B6B6_9RHOB|nr:hypothetical protein JSE7799_00293 [Jannaschia seosinensis]
MPLSLFLAFAGTALVVLIPACLPLSKRPPGPVDQN